MYDQLKNMDSREIQLPETVFIRDIDTRVFQAIALQCLAKIPGIGLQEGNLIDSLLGREVERVKGIHVIQDQKNHSIEVRVEINVIYGVNIPKKAEEIQEKLVEELSHLTGLHVSSVHVIFKDLLPPKTDEETPVQGEFEEVF
jgi:uncharacterized alkaline shock family protein YloU